MSGAPPGRAVGLAVLAASLLAIGLVTLLPAPVSTTLPFLCLACGSRPGIDLLLNVLLFLPLGVGLALTGVSWRRAALLSLALTVGIEALQYTVVPGRFASLRDVLANSAGGMLGWRLGMMWRLLALPTRGRARALGAAAALAWIASQAFTAWALEPVYPPAPWWAQIRLHDRDFSSVFMGSIVRLAVGAIPIRWSDQLADPEPVRRALAAGAPLYAEVTDVAPSRGAAPIFFLAVDEDPSDVAGLAQVGTDAFFRLRTRATLLGFRTPALRLRGVFPEGTARDTVRLSGRYLDRTYIVRAERAGERREIAVAASASWGWALLVPIAHYSFGAEVRWLTALWLSCFAGVLGYWLRLSAIGSTRRARAATALSMAVAAIAALALVPAAFGLAAAHWSEWLGAAAGSAAGWWGAQTIEGTGAMRGPLDPPG